MNNPPRSARSRRRRPRRQRAIALGVGILLLALGVLLYLRLPRPGREGPQASPPRAPSPVAEAPVPTPAGTPTPEARPEELPIEVLPDLDVSDAWVREAAGRLASGALLPEWLGHDDLIRRFVASVDNVADGNSPRPHLPFLAPGAPFRVVVRKGRVLTDPRSFRRYDGVAGVVGALDVERAAQLYRRGKPLLDEAFRNLGVEEVGFEERLAAAIRSLLATPVPSGEEELVRPGVSWEYRDGELEALLPAQKHLLRMGPENVRRIQEKLRELAESLGLPVDG